MIDTDKILKYVPTSHGEHGVNSVIHRSILKNNFIKEVYSNPPGASWAQAIIQNPLSKEYFAWDHIPRNQTCAKRPDAVFQYNHNDHIELLILESKENILGIEKNINEHLKDFFKGNEKFNGLFNRPTQLRKNLKNNEWEYIGNNKKLDEYWIKKATDRISLYSAFAFGFDPEYYKNEKSFDNKLWRKRMMKLRDNYSLDLIIGVGWTKTQHIPFVKIIPNNIFCETQFYSCLKSIFS